MTLYLLIALAWVVYLAALGWAARGAICDQYDDPSPFTRLRRLPGRLFNWSWSLFDRPRKNSSTEDPEWYLPKAITIDYRNSRTGEYMPGEYIPTVTDLASVPLRNLLAQMKAA